MGSRLKIWPLPAWEKVEAKLAEFSIMNDAVEKYLSLTSYYGQQVEMDSQARVLIPQILRGAAKLDAEVVVMGKIDHLEVHNQAAFEARLAGECAYPGRSAFGGSDSEWPAGGKLLRGCT